MTHSMLSQQFNAFSSLLQEVTNVSVTAALDPENKENVPPGAVVRQCGWREGDHSRRNSDGNVWRNKLLNTSQMSDCCTPLKDGVQQRHTGLTPGNNKKWASRRRSSLNLSGLDYHLLEDSTNSEVREGDIWTSPLRFASVMTDQHSRLCEIFHGVTQLPKAHNNNESITSTPSHVAQVLQESEDDEEVVHHLPTDEWLADVEPISEPRLQPQAGELFSVPTQLFAPLTQQQHKYGEHEITVQSRLQRQSQQQKQRPLLSVTHAWPEKPAPAQPQAEQTHTVTRVVHGAPPLIAVAGRRVPIDKLHLLLNSTAVNGVEGDSNSLESVDRAPLVPSSRPMPAAGRTKVVPAGHSGDSATDNVLHSSSRRPPSHHHSEMVVIEFSKGVLMRFKSNPAHAPPVVGKRYLVTVRASRSPYDNVEYSDAGVCVHVVRHQSDSHSFTNPPPSGAPFCGDMEKGIYDGNIIRCMDTEDDEVQLQALADAREKAIVECQRHFRFLNLPFELVDAHYTFDRTICIIYYQIQRQEGTSGQPNVSRLMRMLQFKLRCRVHLKADTCSQ
ncbi:PSP1 C terminal conserved region [Trypanosoma vivax]|uniref:Putative expression site-associated gene (ESAG) protein n=1 Tax=Trypanosoma vivax (strain Y486) TaxID=1055687 RepID=G0TWV4_TRYVY|nr:PSP1 C terminal conserved region [Trypanosoma vivax]CCC48442.1 putative expression site-associated gene (ESAG) protein [Trypanosoma vivax Y486]